MVTGLWISDLRSIFLHAVSTGISQELEELVGWHGCVAVASFLGSFLSRRWIQMNADGSHRYRQCELVTLAYTLWCVCNHTEDFVLIFGDDKEQASDSLHMIKHALESNPLLKVDFPEVTGKNIGNWYRTAIVTKNGIKVKAVGLNQKVGRHRYNNHCPSLVIFNVPEDHYSTFLRHDPPLWPKWFNDLLGKNGDSKTNMIAVGTFCQMAYSLLGEIYKAERIRDWHIKKYSALCSESTNQSHWVKWISIYQGEENYCRQTGPDTATRYFNDHRPEMLSGAKVLWPEHESYLALMKFQLRYGDGAFYHKKKINPQGTWEYKQRIGRMKLQFADIEAQCKREANLKRNPPKTSPGGP